MRLSSRDLQPIVAISPESIRPIRLRTGALTYMFTPDQAIELATQLADAVDELKEWRAP